MVPVPKIRDEMMRRVFMTTTAHTGHNILVRSVVTVPPHNIKRRESLLGHKQISLKLGNNLIIDILVLEPACFLPTTERHVIQSTSSSLDQLRRRNETNKDRPHPTHSFLSLHHDSWRILTWQPVSRNLLGWPGRWLQWVRGSATESVHQTPQPRSHAMSR